jgi:hypothetical protein
MKIIAPMIVVVLLFGVMPCLAYQSLQEVYDQAGGQDGYDKYIELDPTIEYLGDLNIAEDGKICIMGHGAKVFPQSDYNIHIGVSRSWLDIQNCVFIGGGGAVYIGLDGSGTVKNNTIVGCLNAGIRTYSIGITNDVVIYDNIIIDCYDGFFCNEEEHPDYLGYNTVFNAERYRYVEFCSG